jgi:hypothetical protein
MAVEPRRYQFGTIEERGLILGLRGGQVGVLAVASVAAVGLFRSGQASGLLLAVAVFGAGAAAAFVSVRGATLEQWAPALLHWGRGTGRRQWVVDVRVPRDSCRTSPPPGLEGLTILDAVATGYDQPIGILHDRRRGTFSAVLEVRGGAFALLDVADKQRRLASWATILASLGRAGSAVSRLQWIERTFPAGPNRLPLPSMRRGVAGGGGGAPPGCLESYAELIEEAGPATQDHETLVVVTMSAREISRTARHTRGRLAAAAAVVGREVRLLEGQLRTADLSVERILTPAACERALQRSYANEPGAEPSAGAGHRSSWPWPVAAEVSWSTYRTDGVWHATYWMSEWPRVEVGPDFLAPLLLQASGRRTVAVTMAPTSPAEATRSVEAAKTADLADGELRRRAGFLNSARRQRESEHIHRRETELAEGHADYRYSGFVTVTAADADSLEQACAEVEQLAHQAHLELRRLYGRQEAAFTWTLPLGRGLG